MLLSVFNSDALAEGITGPKVLAEILGAMG